MWLNERTVGAVSISVDIKHSDSSLITHALLCDAYDLLIVFTESYTFDRCRELPVVQAFSCLDGPQTEGVVRWSWNEESWLSFGGGVMSQSDEGCEKKVIFLWTTAGGKGQR